MLGFLLLFSVPRSWMLLPEPTSQSSDQRIRASMLALAEAMAWGPSEAADQEETRLR